MMYRNVKRLAAVAAVSVLGAMFSMGCSEKPDTVGLDWGSGNEVEVIDGLE